MCVCVCVCLYVSERVCLFFGFTQLSLHQHFQTFEGTHFIHLFFPDDIPTPRPTPRNLPTPVLGGAPIDGVTAKVGAGNEGLTRL